MDKKIISYFWESYNGNPFLTSDWNRNSVLDSMRKKTASYRSTKGPIDKAAYKSV